MPMNLYPNPTQSTITIPLNGLVPNLHIEVLNMLGNRFYSVEVREKKESLKIDVSELTIGLYMIKIQLGNGSAIMTKFFKE
jgi:hypothetical protein